MTETLKEKETMLAKYKQLYSSLAKANQNAQQVIRDLQAQNKTLTLNLINANKAVEINKTILRQATEHNNQTEQTLIELLTNLKAKLREMGYNGDFDSLGN